MGYFDSISGITSSYSDVPNINNGLAETVRHADVKLGTMAADTVTLSENARSLAKANELKETNPQIYKQIRKQVIAKKPSLNGDKNKCADAIMTALRKKSEYKEIAAKIDAKFDPPKVKGPTSQELTRQKQLQTEREISKKALEQHKADKIAKQKRQVDKWLKLSEGESAPKMIEGDPVHRANLQKEFEDVFSGKNIKKQFEKVSKRMQRLEKEAPKRNQAIAALKQKIQTARDTLAQLSGKIGADEAIKQQQTIIAKNEARLTRINNYVDGTKRLFSSLSEMVKPANTTSSEAATVAGKGLWHWLTKTAKGKWTSAGAAIVAVGAGIYAYLSGDKNVEGAKKFDQAA